MTISAFHGDPALKARLVDPVRPRWAARELLPAAILKWVPDERMYSLCGALAESQEQQVFEQRTGIPLALAMLSEALISASIEITPDPSSPAGFAMHGDDAILAFGMEWLDAVRPGADLSDVVPRYAAQALETVLGADFPLAEQIEPAVAAAGARVLGLWRRELAGDDVGAVEWRAARVAAVEASERCGKPWCYPVAAFIESISWPVRSIAGEFVALFQSLLQSWLTYVRLPFFGERDREDQTLFWIGLRRMTLAEAEGGLDEEAMATFFDDTPDVKRAMYALGDADTRARLRAARVGATVATTPVVRQQMDVLLQLIGNAGEPR